MSDQHIRKVQTSVTNFIYCGEEYLFLHRNGNKRVDANRLNGIGGRVDGNENYLEACLRETREETGYEVKSDEVRFCGVVRLEGGYSEDWVMCFFKIEVPDKRVPKGLETEDGKLMWLHKDKVLDSDYELVDDLYYCFKDVVEGKSVFFMNCQIDEKEKISSVSKSLLNS